MLEAPLIPAAFLFAAVGLFTRLRWDAAWPLALAGLTGALVASMHPLVYELDRLSVVTWIPVAFGLAALTTHHSRKDAAPYDRCSTQERRPPPKSPARRDPTVGSVPASTPSPHRSPS